MKVLLIILIAVLCAIFELVCEKFVTDRLGRELIIRISTAIMLLAILIIDPRIENDKLV